MTGVAGRRRHAGRVALVVVATLLLAACGGAEGDDGSSTGPSATRAPAPPVDQAVEAAFGELERRQLPVVVAVARGDAPVVVREFGALAEDGVAPDAALADVGSITKTLTGVAVSALAEDGAVRFDETLADVFPDVPADKAAITVEQLLTHTGGFPGALGDDAEQLDREAYLRRAWASELVEVPGTRYAYSNVGYSLLAAIVEVRSGQPYEAYLRDEVLAPAGVEGIGYSSAYDDARSLRSAGGDTVREASWGGHDASWHLIGNGGLVATADAFVAFRRALTSGRILEPGSLARLQVPHVPEDEAGSSSYGYGLVVQDVPGIGRLYWHDGGNDVFSAEWADHADRGDVVFVAGVDGLVGEEDGAVASAAMDVVRRSLYPDASSADGS